MVETPDKFAPHWNTIIDGLGDDSKSERALIEAQGGAAWAKHYYPHIFTRDFAKYQLELWNWIDSIEPGVRQRPRWDCEPRSVGKTANGEAGVVKLVATEKVKMVGYCSLDEQKAGKHFESIKTLLEAPKLVANYPDCKPRMQTLRNSIDKWSRDAIITKSGIMVVPLTLLGSSRGWKSSDGSRFDLIVLDDIDKLGQSADVIKKMLELLKGEILAAGTDKTNVLGLQNLIHRESIATQVLDYRADILTDRDFCGPFPMLKHYEAEKRDLVGGGKKWFILSGEAYDPAIPVEYAEAQLNIVGKSTFDREMQQEVWKVEEDKDFREYDERWHVITYSEFMAYFEAYKCDVRNTDTNEIKIPARWHCGTGLDYGSTPKHPSCSCLVTRPDRTTPLDDCHFIIGEVCLPKFPREAGEEAELVSPGRVADAVKALELTWEVTDSMVEERVMSHEASAAMMTMVIDLPEERQVYFRKWKARRGSGVPQIQSGLEIDYAKPHPFRKLPTGYKINGEDVGGRAIMGRPRRYLVVPDDQGALFVDSDGKLRVYGAKDAKGLARLRFEIPLYSHRNQGEKKIDDDMIDGWRGLESSFGVESGDFTEKEKLEAALPETLREETLAQMEMSATKDSLLQARRVAEERVRREMSIPQRSASMTRFSRR